MPGAYHQRFLPQHHHLHFTNQTQDWAATGVPSTQSSQNQSPSNSHLPQRMAKSKPLHLATQSRPKPWYTFITLDLLLSILARSIFHPAIVLIFYLCLASVHKHRTALAYNTLVYAAFLAGVEVFLWLNHRLTYGAPRKVEWKDEVVVITGGGSGLGRVLAEMLMLSKGVRVAILDVREPDDEATEWMEGRGELWWGVCDVGDEKQVKEMARRVESELGRPTILINNAAIPVHGAPLVPRDSGVSSLLPTQAADTLRVNALAHFNTLSAFLPYLTSGPNGGTIVTISSILAILSPSLLSDYAAAKAALSSLHQTVTHEIALHPSKQVRQNLKTVLVEPGQMDTALFASITSVPWYANFFGPVLAAKDVAREIMQLLDRGDAGVLRMPFYAKCMPLYGAMPGALQLAVRWFSGIDQAIIHDKLTKQK